MMINLLHALQALFVMCWTVPLVLFVRPAWQRGGDSCDRLAAALWWASLSIIAFPLRWLVQGAPLTHIGQSELVLWSLLYVTGSVAAIALAVAAYRVCHGR